jgi:4-hydroxy-4-methyl-2-oxoglutarate aldolase
MPNQHVIVRTSAGPASEYVEAAAGYGVSTIHEAQGRRGLMKPYLRPIYSGPAIAGRAVTVLCHPGDNLMIHAAVEQCREGDLLVVTTTSESTDGMFGDLLATSLKARGVVGLVIDAGVRDVATLTEMSFPVWSRAVSAQGTVKATPGSVNVPVVAGGAIVHPGDLVVADDDGVVVVALADVPAVCAAAQKREDLEADKRATLASGVLGLDLYSLRPQLADLGVTYVDAADPAPVTTSHPATTNTRGHHG